jgi:nucleotide-binding universal stress UspA family protein
MYKKILVGVDGGQGGRDAVAFAQAVASDDTAVTVSYVLLDLLSGDIADARGTLEAERDRITGLLTRACAEAGLVAELEITEAQSVGEGLHRLADSIHADALIIGSTRHGLLGRVLIGDDTWAALNGAPCAVAVVPAGYASESHVLSEIGVAYDGRPESKHALAVARELAARHHARLSAMKVVLLPSYAYAGAAAGVVPAIEGVVDTALEELEALGGVEPHASYGVPAEELAVYSASVAVLVVGSRGYGPLGRLVHGSVSRQLARLARSPVLVLPRSVPDDARVTDPTV